jgi:FSR family fosmidomycin resistance protein-like MFS transporter
MGNSSIQKSTIVSVSAAHLLNDWYMNLIPILMPFLVAAGFGVEAVSFAISAFTITSSLSQPAVGYLVDKRNQQWMVYVGTLWLALLLSGIGYIHNQYLLLLVAALAGLGAAAFHPQASAMVSAASGNRKNLCQAIFGAAGNLGWSLTPLVVIPLVGLWGLEITPFFVLPGIVVAVLLARKAPRTAPQRGGAPVAPLLDVLRPAWRELTMLILVIALRTLTQAGLVAFLPLYLQKEHVSLVASGHLLFFMLFSGAIGGILGGYLSDRVGKRAVIVASLFLAALLFHAFLYSTDAMRPVLLALAGGSLLASFSPTVVMAQELFKRNAAMASGFSLGFGIGLGGLGVGLVGLYVKHSGVDSAIHLLLFLPVVAMILALWLKEARPEPVQAVQGA